MDIVKSANKIVEQIPDGFSEIEKARYVYIQLGRLFSFDEKYWLGNEKEKKKIYRKSMNSPIDIRQIKKGHKAICVSISRTYQDLLAQIGMESDVYKVSDEDPHVFSRIKIDGKEYEADLQRDLKYIQSQRKTKHFGISMNEQVKSIDEEKIEEIDKKIGYNYAGEQDIAGMIESLRRELSGEKELGIKLEKILSEANKPAEIKDMGYIEKMAYYDWMMKNLLSDKERRKIKEIYLRKRDEEEPKYAVCLSVDNSQNGYTRFLYKQDEEGYRKINEIQLMAEIANGMEVMNSCKIPGMKRNQGNKPKDNER